MSNIIKTKSFEVAIYAKGDPDSPKLALMLPGRLDTKDYAHLKSHVDFLSERGFYAVAIDPPGTWESPGNLDEYSTTLYVKCVGEIIEYYGNRPTTLVGHSRGGATSMLSSKFTAVESLVLVNASYSGNPSRPDESLLINGKLRELRDLPPGDHRTDEKVEFMMSMLYFDDGLNHDPLESLKKFEGKKLLIHATDDEFNPAVNVEKIYDTLPEPKRFLEIPKDHDYRLYPEIIDQVNQEISKFLGL